MDDVLLNGVVERLEQLREGRARPRLRDADLSGLYGTVGHPDG